MLLLLLFSHRHRLEILHAMNIIIIIITFGWVQYVNQMMRYLLKREN